MCRRLFVMLFLNRKHSCVNSPEHMNSKSCSGDAGHILGETLDPAGSQAREARSRGTKKNSHQRFLQQHTVGCFGGLPVQHTFDIDTRTVWTKRAMQWMWMVLAWRSKQCKIFRFCCVEKPYIRSDMTYVDPQDLIWSCWLSWPIWTTCPGKSWCHDNVQKLLPSRTIFFSIHVVNRVESPIAIVAFSLTRQMRQVRENWYRGHVQKPSRTYARKRQIHCAYETALRSS